jgi:hypothetical protein
MRRALNASPEMLADLTAQMKAKKVALLDESLQQLKTAIETVSR